MAKKVRSALTLCAVLAAALLSSPALASEDKPAWLQYKGYDKSNTIAKDQAHLSAGEIEDWVRSRTVESLSFHPFSYDSELNDLREYFTDKGWEDYTTYINWVKIPDMVNKKKYSLTSVLEQELNIVSQETIDDYVSWIIKMPVMLSFHEAYAESSGKSERPIASATINLTLTLKRVDKGADSNNIAIHGWHVKRPKASRTE
ncbi:MAG: DotI/IcmL family type IV secretion protein [Pseudomonadota bacterium]